MDWVNDWVRRPGFNARKIDKWISAGGHLFWSSALTVDGVRCAVVVLTAPSCPSVVICRRGRKLHGAQALTTRPSRSKPSLLPMATLRRPDLSLHGYLTRYAIADEIEGVW